MKRLLLITILFCNAILLFGQTSPCKCGDVVDCGATGVVFTDEATAVAAIDSEDPTMIASSTNCYDLSSDNILAKDGLVHQFCYDYIHNGGAFAFETQLAVPDVASCIPNSSLIKNIYESTDCATALVGTGTSTDDGWPIYNLPGATYKICTTIDLDEMECCGIIEGICTYIHPVCPEITSSGLDLTASTTSDCTLSSNLFISEYIEGSGNNKCIEIYNGTGADIDLGVEGYSIVVSNNGGTTTSTTNLTGTIVSGDVYVVCDSNTNLGAAFFAEKDQNLSGNVYNGNDAVVLMQNTDTLDIIGQVGCNPGVWTTGAFSTEDVTLVRDPSVIDGVTTNSSSSCTFPTLASQWISFPQNTSSELGSHVTDCNVCQGEDFDLNVHSGLNLPDGGTIDWYYNSTSTFDPFAGEGTMLVTSSVIDGTFPISATASINDIALCNTTIYLIGILNPTTPASCEPLAQTPAYPLAISCPNPTILEMDMSALIDNDSIICSGDEAIITVNETFDSYLWSEGNATTQAITVTPLVTTDYTVVVTDGAGCTASETVTVVVNPLPVATINVTEMSGSTDDDEIICEGDNATLTVMEGSLSYLWSELNATTQFITVSPTITTSYTVTVTNIGGCTSTSEVIIIVDPEITSTDDVDLCFGESHIVGTSTYTMSGTYIDVLTASNGCDSTVTTNLVFNTLPTASISGALDYCEGSSTILMAASSPGYTYEWSEMDSVRNELVVDAPGSYTVTVTDGNNCTSTDMIVVNELPLPVVTVDADVTTACEDDVITFTFTGTPDASFTFDDGTTASTETLDGIGEFTLMITAATTDVVVTLQSITDGTCSDLLTESEIVTVTPLSAAGTDGTLTVCAGGDTNTSIDLPAGLLGSPETGGSWNDDNGAGVDLIDPTNVDFTGITAGDYDFTYTVTGTSPCPNATAVVTVTVEDEPTIVVNGTTCSADLTTYDIDLTVSSGTVSVNVGTLVDNGAGFYSVTNVTSGATVTVTTLDGTGCSTSIDISEDCSCPAPNDPTSDGNETMCEGGTIPTLSVTVDTGLSANWYAVATGGTILANGTETTTYTPIAPIVGMNSYFAEVVDLISGCTGDRVEVVLTVNPNPTAETATLNECDDDADGFTIFTLTDADATVLNGQVGMTVTYHAQLIEANDITGGMNSLSSPYINVIANMQTIFVRVEDTNGCFTTNTVDLIVDPLPTFDVDITETSGIINNDEICLGDDATITVSVAGLMYEWSEGNATTQAITVTPLVTTDYTVVVTDGAGCTASETVTVVVNPLPVATINVTEMSGSTDDDEIICEGDNATLTVMEGSLSYLWSELNATTQFITVSPTITTSYTVTVTNIGGCTSTSEVIIIVDPEITSTDDVDLCFGESHIVGTSTYTMSGTYIDVLTASNGCDSTVTTNLVFNTLPTASISGALDYCEGSSTILMAASSPGYTYEWSEMDSVRNELVVDAPGSYTVTVTDGNNCTSTDMIVVNELPLPVVTVDADVTTACEDDVITFTFTGTPDASFTFDDGTTASTETLDGIGEFTLMITAATTDVVVTLQSITDGTCSDLLTESEIVTVTPLSAAGTDGTLTVCAGGDTNTSIDLPAGLLGSPETGGSWNDDNGAGVDLIDPTNVDFTGITAGDYDFTYTVTGTSPCPNATAVVTVTVEDEPTIVVNGTTCSADLTTYDIDLTVSSGTVSVNVGTLVDNGAGFYSVTNVTSGATVTVTTLDGTGCSTSIDISEDCSCPAPNDPTSDGNETMCEGGTIPTLSVTVDTGLSANWYAVATGGTILANGTETTTYTPIAPIVGMNSYFAEVVDLISGCTGDRVEVVLTVNPNPTAETATLNECDDDADGFTIFTLTDADATVLNGQVGMTVTYHAQLIEANDITGGMNSLSSPYMNVIANMQTIFVRVEDTNGCFTTNTVDLIVDPLPTFDVDITETSGIINNDEICLGDDATITVSVAGLMYEWSEGNATTQAITVTPLVTTDYTVVVTDGAGCTASETVTVVVNPLPVATINVTEMSGSTDDDEIICEGDNATLTVMEGSLSYLWSELNATTQFITVSPTITTSYTVTVTNIGGCTSTSEVIIIVDSEITSTDDVDLCFGESHIVGTSTYTMSGTYIDVLMASNGCDSTVTTNLVIGTEIISTDDVDLCFGESHIVGTNTYTMSGTYIDVLTASNGCDSTVTTNLVIGAEITSTDDVDLCFGESHTVGTSTYTMSGTYIDVLMTSNGCDSTVTTNLIIGAEITSTDDVDLCFGESHIVGTSTYTMSGTYIDVLMTSNGCDSTVTTNLVIGAEITSTDDVDLCFGESHIVGTSTYTMSGTYIDVLTASNGCDSTVTTNLVIDSEITSTDDVDLCFGESHIVGTSTYTMSGTYIDVLTASNGCDSTVTTNLVIGAEITSTDDVDLCFGESHIVGTSTYTMSGTYIDVLTASNGCDSTVTTNLVIGAEITSTDDVDLCFGESHIVGTSTYTMSGTYIDVLMTSNGCDSTVTTNLVIGAEITSTDDVDLCFGESHIVGTSTYTMSGTYTDVLMATNGCDSTVTTNLVIGTEIISTDDVELCFGESHIVGTSTYTMSGTYIDVLTASNGCDSTVTTNLVIGAEITSTDDVDLCFGESHIVGTSTYTMSGTYIDVLTASNGCDSTVTTNLVIGAEITSTDDVDLCFGESHTVGTSTYTMSGTYIDVLTASNGCDSTVTTNLVIGTEIISTDDVELCFGESHIVGTSTYTMSGTYTDVLMASNGCDSTVTTNLVIGTEIISTDDVELCFGESHIVGTSTYTMSGTYIDVLMAMNGCDSTVTTNLVIGTEITSTDDVELCFGESHIVGTSTYTMSGTYIDVLTTSNGCDSTVTTNLVIGTEITSTDDVELCFGESHIVGTSTYTMSGTYTDVLMATNGCDSTVTTNLVIGTEIISTDDVELCFGESHIVGTSTYTMSGTYIDVLTASNGCDSTVTTNLVIGAEITSTDDVDLCFGESHIVGTSTYTMSGTYIDVLTASNGCDSTVTTNLVIGAEITSTDDVDLCFGESHTVGTSTYTMSGTYTDVLMATNGCDSTVTTNLVIGTEIISTDDVELCFGESHIVGTSTYTMSGTYIDVLTASNGCDSTVTTNLVIGAEITSTDDVDLCFGESHIVGTSTYTMSGTYIDVLTASNGCDSTVTTNLVIGAEITSTDDVDLCFGESHTVGTSTYTMSGTYIDVLMTSNGCDSTVTTNLVIGAEITSTDDVDLCFGESHIVGTSTYTMSGTYIDVLTASNGCDSTVTTNLVIDSEITSTDDVDLCFGESHIVGTSTYTMSGTYIDVLTASNGCDSTVTTNLVIGAEITSTDNVDLCFGESHIVGTSTYTMSGTYIDVLTASNGCDSTVTTNLVIGAEITSTDNVDLCFGESHIVGTSTYTMSGTYIDVLMTSNGCDSTVTTNLVIGAEITSTDNVDLCFGESHIVGTSTYTMSGTYIDVLMTSNGCDSTVTTNLVIGAEITSTDDVDLCFGESHIVGTSTYTMSGTYTDVLMASNGCDSTVTTNLVIGTEIISTDDVELCFGESHIVGTSTYTMSGTYTDVLLATNGCDSTVTTNLVIGTEIISTDDVELCFGESHIVGTSTYTMSGTYTDVLMASNGCDSTVTTNLVIGAEITSTDDVDLCFGESHTVGTSTYTMSGTYIDVLMTSNGCDSTVTTNLVIGAEITSTDDVDLCFGESHIVGTSTYTMSGTYTDVLMASNGCDSTVTTNLVIGTEIVATANVQLCLGESYTIGTNTYTTSGVYTDVLMATNGCDSVITTNLTFLPSPIPVIDGIRDVCDGSSTTLTVSQVFATYAWSNGLGVGQSALITAPGTYFVTVTDMNGCTGVNNATVTNNSVNVTAVVTSDYDGFGVSCNGSADGSATVEILNGIGPFLYDWSGGLVTSNADVEGLVANTTYTVTVTDFFDCSGTATVTLTEPTPLILEVSTIPETCFETYDAQIIIDTVYGGSGDTITDYLFSIDEGTDFQTDTVFEFLTAGAYQVIAMDPSGCTNKIDVTIAAPQESFLDLGPDVQIDLGDSIQIIGATNLQPDILFWSPTIDLSCIDCLAPWASPEDDIIYSLTVIDENGCTATDDILIEVLKNRDVYIPNAFTPDESGYNDLFTIYGSGQVDRVIEMRIYDRWGELVYQETNFPVNEPGYGWDGRMNGKPMNSAVFVYYTRVRFIDGTIEEFKGDMTLVR